MPGPAARTPSCGALPASLSLAHGQLVSPPLEYVEVSTLLEGLECFSKVMFSNRNTLMVFLEIPPLGRVSG